jgi:type I restriction enzyme S subunit
MAGEWQLYEVSDLLNVGKLVVGDGYRAKNSELSRTGLPFARAGNINNGFQFADAEHFPIDALSKVGNKVSQPGDVVFTSKGTVGRFAYVRQNTPRFVYSPQLCFWRSLDPDLIQSRFLYYWMCGGEFFVQFKGVAGQTDMAEYVSLTDQRRMRITLPSIAEQRAIAHILGTVDDKIELNGRMNETLEVMGHALFKSWFVDFDPVRAKAEGCDPGLPEPLADLFPASFEDSELGEIPKGWSATPLYNIARYINGATYAAFQPNDERRGLPIIKIAELKAGVTTQTKFSDVQMPEKYRIAEGEILFSWSGNPDTSIDTFVWSEGAGWLNQHIFRVLPPHPYERAFVLSTLKTLRPVFAEIARNKQTTGLGHVTAEDMKRLLVARPDDRVLLAWSKLASPLHERTYQNSLEIGQLSKVRDTLLPKLISGELRVADPGRFLGGGN